MRFRFHLLPFCGLAAALFLTVACSKSKYGALPRIGQPDALVMEGKALLQSKPVGCIEQAEWPPTIASMRPILVQATQTGILVTFEALPGIGAHGYLIASSDHPRDPKLTLHGAGSAGLYEFEWSP